MKCLGLNICILLTLIANSPGLTQGFLQDDYQIFGRKEPISLGSVFSTLSSNGIFANPAQVAFANENRINVGLGGSGIGDGRFISLMAPNLSISSSRQSVERNDFLGFSHEKRLLHFAFGFSLADFGYGGRENTVGLGVAIKRQADRMLGLQFGEEVGGSAVSFDLGMLYRFGRLEIEMTLLDFNNPQLGETEFSYGRGFAVGTRFMTNAGLTLALQGVGGNSYAGSDFGLSFGAEEAFMDKRLVARLQLTSFFEGAEATVQNISGSIGYRLDPTTNLMAFLKDLEFSYALSFLALPNNVGTHMIVVTKYF